MKLRRFPRISISCSDYPGIFFFEHLLCELIFGYLLCRKLRFLMSRTSQFLYISHFIGSRSQVFGNVDVLKDYAKFTAVLESIFNKAADFQFLVCNFIGKETLAFPMNFAKFLKIRCYRITPRDCFCNF